MKVKYEIFDEYQYNSTCRIINDMYPDNPMPTVEEYTEYGTGEIVGFIKGGLLSEDKFLIADDETGEFKKVEVKNCTVLKD